MPDTKFTILDIISIIGIIIGLVWFTCSVIRNVKIDRIKTWPTTNATVVNYIVESETTTHTKNTSYNHKKITRDSSTMTNYYPKIFYKYNVNGKEYQSRNLYYGGEKTYDSLNIKNFIMQFTPGTIIKIYYNPNNPEESYIYNGVKSYIGIIISSIFILLSLGFLYYNHFYKISSESKHESPEKSSKIESPEKSSKIESSEKSSKSTSKKSTISITPI